MSVRIFKDPGGNPKRDFALIEMDSISSGMRAMEALEDDEYEGPPIKAEKFQGVISNDSSKPQPAKPAPIVDDEDDLGEEEYAEGGYKSSSFKSGGDDGDEDEDLKAGFQIYNKPDGNDIDTDDEDLGDSDDDYDPYAEDEDAGGDDDDDESTDGDTDGKEEDEEDF